MSERPSLTLLPPLHSCSTPEFGMSPIPEPRADSIRGPPQSVPFSSKTFLVNFPPPNQALPHSPSARLIPHSGVRTVQEIEQDEDEEDHKSDMFGFRFEWPH
jgi:hypothetical protein